jgi:predicted transcriptional regulator YheO
MERTQLNSLYESLDDLKRLAKMLAVQFGPKTEIAIHDLTRGYESTIVAIENGAVTGRKVGSCGSNLGLEAYSSSKPSTAEDAFGYFTFLKDGRIIRSSSIYFYNDVGKLMAALCVNTDITELARVSTSLTELLPNDSNKSGPEEVFAKNISELLAYYIQKCDEVLGHIPGEKMDKAQKLEAIRYLDAKGVFSIAKAGGKICKYLNISKGTLYSYLDVVRENAGSAESAADGAEDE